MHTLNVTHTICKNESYVSCPPSLSIAFCHFFFFFSRLHTVIDKYMQTTEQYVRRSNWSYSCMFVFDECYSVAGILV